MTYLHVINLTCLSLHRIADPIRSLIRNVNVSVLACTPNAIFLLLETCIPGCFLTDLTPTDTVRQCPDRGLTNTLPIPGGVVCYNGTTAGSEAVYICDDGFHQNGAATRVCQNGGVWNGSTPQCLPDSGRQDGITPSVPTIFHPGTSKHYLGHFVHHVLLNCIRGGVNKLKSCSKDHF